MPYRILNVDEVARYLHLKRADIDLLVKNQEVPFEKRGGRIVFKRQEIDAWASQRILGLKDRGLTEYHKQSVNGTREVLAHEAIMPDLLSPQYIAPALKAKTKASMLREMVALAEATGRVNDVRDLLSSLEAREELCSTGLPGGLALLHPRHHQPYMFESSFIVLGRTLQGIHFGAPDRQPSDLFFLICCQDDRLHLHTLARLCMMAQKSDLLLRLRETPEKETMFQEIVAAEAEVLAGKKNAER